ncbi:MULTISPECIES: MFS transporter [Photorhabdus]|uniref:MFS transporter n=1 Tax=Photorhabdus TaxID=29487 RepID=UPI0021D4D8DC|nr:MFS transporter [Photorhabdus kayaii]MCT8352404.1 MFS transporter [Photorhabdus kayaii]
MDNMKRNKRNVLLAANISYILVILDSSIVNVALPTIKESLSLGVTTLQWVVNAYLVLFASLLLSGGALCDRFGSKSVYITGLGLFTLSSALCGISSEAAILLTGRVLQGISAAILVPGSLALITHTYTDKTERTRAIASWASWGGIALVAGPVIGGWLTEYLSWRSIFLVNVPLCLAGIFLTLRVQSPEHEHKSLTMDIKGQLLLFLTIFLFIAGVIRLNDSPQINLNSVILLCLSLIIMTAFIVVERRSKAPMLPLELFRRPNFSAISWIFFSGAFSFFGAMFILTFWFQDIQHLSATQTGMALLPLSISVILGNKVSGWLARRYQTSHMMIVGAMIRLVGFSGLLVTQFNNDYAYLFVPLVLIGFGGGLGSPMSTSLFMQSTPKQYTGVASGVSRATGQIGSAFAVAVFGQMVNSEKLFILNMKYAVITIIIATLSILIINFLFVKNDIDEYHNSITLKADK